MMRFALGLSLSLTMAMVSAEQGYATQRSQRLNVKAGLTDGECVDLGCKVVLDKSCKTDFGDGI